MWFASAPLNHVLAQNAWAMQRLAPLAGRTFSIQGFPLPALAFTIQADGSVHDALPKVPTETTLSATPDALLRYFLVEPHDPALIHIGGDTALGEEIGHVLAHLDWEAEEDLSRLFGDIVAHRLTGFAKSWLGWRKETAWNVAAATSEYISEEQPMIASLGRLAQFTEDVATVSAAVEQLENRIEKLLNRQDAKNAK